MQNQRVAFVKQPARVVMIHFTSCMSLQTQSAIHKALENLFCLTNSMTGPCRVPLFGLIKLGDRSEAVLPLQNLRGGYSRLHAALEDIKYFTPSEEIHSGSDIITDALHEAVAMYRRQTQLLNQSPGSCPLLEITIITCDDGPLVARLAERTAKTLDQEKIKGIHVICLNDIDRAQAEPFVSQESDESDGFLPGTVHYMTMDNSVWSIHNYFMGWFHDTNTENEHLHLTFPGENGQDLVLKCDCTERILNPALLPHQAQFGISLEALMNKQIPMSGGKCSAGQSRPIYSLEVLCKVPANSICDSIVFGEPQVIQHTSCWKIEWEELDTNQDNFHALCQQLHHKEEVLVAKLAGENSPPSRGKGFSYQAPPAQRPRGVFLVLPSSKATLLVKPVATGELLLPVTMETTTSPSEASIACVTDVLEKVEHRDCFNPYSVDTGLFSCLQSQLFKSANLSGNNQSKRRTPSRQQQPPPTAVAHPISRPGYMTSDPARGGYVTGRPGNVTSNPARGGYVTGRPGCMTSDPARGGYVTGRPGCMTSDPARGGYVTGRPGYMTSDPARGGHVTGPANADRGRSYHPIDVGNYHNPPAECYTSATDYHGNAKRARTSTNSEEFPVEL